MSGFVLLTASKPLLKMLIGALLSQDVLKALNLWRCGPHGFSLEAADLSKGERWWTLRRVKGGGLWGVGKSGSACPHFQGFEFGQGGHTFLLGNKT